MWVSTKTKQSSLSLARVASLILLVVALPGCATHPSGVLIAEAAATPGATVVDMLVATTRRPSPEPGVLYSGERGDLSFTEIAVSIPPDNVRKAGEVQWPSDMPANPATDFTTVKVESVSVPQGVKDWAKRALSRDRHVLIFVHGFNTQYDEAVYRLAQIVHDSEAKVTPVLFTWPSRGSVLEYPPMTGRAQTIRERLLRTCYGAFRRTPPWGGYRFWRIRWARG